MMNKVSHSAKMGRIVITSRSSLKKERLSNSIAVVVNTENMCTITICQYRHASGTHNNHSGKVTNAKY